MNRLLVGVAIICALSMAGTLAACNSGQSTGQSGQASSATAASQSIDASDSEKSASIAASNEGEQGASTGELESAQMKSQLEPLTSDNASIGNHVGLGKYEQDGNANNGSEEIEWRVLAVEGEKALLLSEYAIDAHSFDSEDDDWETSDLREWLNSSLLNEAFTLEEQSRIEGELFCLSNDEAESYFSNDASRICKATPYSSKQIVVSSHGGYPWWLRSPGNNKGFNGYIEGDFIGLIASCVDYDGKISPGGPYGSLAEIGVRPAMWVRL